MNENKASEMKAAGTGHEARESKVTGKTGPGASGKGRGFKATEKKKYLKTIVVIGNRIEQWATQVEKKGRTKGRKR